jgi:hypothetical protein
MEAEGEDRFTLPIAGMATRLRLTWVTIVRKKLKLCFERDYCGTRTSTSMHDSLADIAYAQGDTATMEKEETFLNDEPDQEMGVFGRHGGIAPPTARFRKRGSSTRKDGRLRSGCS